MIYVLYSINIRSGKNQILGGFLSLEDVKAAWKSAQEAEEGFNFYSWEECYIHDNSQKFRAETNVRGSKEIAEMSDFPF